jgi:hypothetical protein
MMDDGAAGCTRQHCHGACPACLAAWRKETAALCRARKDTLEQFRAKWRARMFARVGYHPRAAMPPVVSLATFAARHRALAVTTRSSQASHLSGQQGLDGWAAAVAAWEIAAQLEPQRPASDYHAQWPTTAAAPAEFEGDWMI